MMIWKKLLCLFRKEEKNTEDASERPGKKKSFAVFMEYAPQILTWYRREKGIPKKDLRLTVVDDGEQPAWKVLRVLETLIADLNLLYVATDRREAFEELAEEAYEERGLLVVIQETEKAGSLPGNLTLDLRDWEKHLDIISEVGYNTLTI